MGMGDFLTGLGGTLGAGLGFAAGEGNRRSADNEYNTAAGLYDQYGNVGLAATKAAQAQQVGQSAYNNVDPATRNAQLQALNQLQTQYRSGGFDPQAQAMNYAAQQSANQQAQQLDAQAQNQAAQRGMSSSGAAMAASRSNGQAAANTGAMQAMLASGQAQGRQQQALQGAMQGAGQMRGQDYQRAEANDAISRFNAGQRTNAAQNAFNNQYNMAQGTRAGLYKQADHQDQRADQTARFYRGTGEGIGNTVGTVADMSGGGGGGGGMAGMMGGG